MLCTATRTYYGWLCNWNTTTVPNGSYVLLSEAFNASGSAFGPGVSITVENPTTGVLVPSSGATLSGSTNLDASASNATSVEFRLFGGTYGFAAPVLLCTDHADPLRMVVRLERAPVPNGSPAYSSCLRPSTHLEARSARA